MIALKTFAKGIAQDIKEYLPPEYADYQYEVVQKQKNNGTLQTGISVRESGQEIAPVIYLDHFYDEIRQGSSIEEVMEKIADEIQTVKEMEAPIKELNLFDYESAKKNLSVVLVNTKANWRMLMQMPHTQIEDLSCICRLEFPYDNGDGVASIKVDDRLLKQWNVSPQEVMGVALENAAANNPPVLMDLMDMIAGMGDARNNILSSEHPFCRSPFETMYVLTNQEKMNGAAVLAYPELMKRVSQIFPEGFYILPSSVHEVMILPKSGRFDPKELGEMVRDVNRREVSREEILSDRVYEYDKEQDRIRQVPESIERGKGVER